MRAQLREPLETTPKKVKAKEPEETAILDTMITSLAGLLDEKGVVSQEEWEQRIKKNLKG